MEGQTEPDPLSPTERSNNLLVPRIIFIGLRNKSRHLLEKGPIVSVRSGAYSYSAPHFFNQFPAILHEAPSVSSFRKQLKTQYFASPPIFRPKDLNITASIYRPHLPYNLCLSLDHYERFGVGTHQDKQCLTMCLTMFSKV